MRRSRVAVLLGGLLIGGLLFSVPLISLSLVGAARAQAPDKDIELPKPTPVEPNAEKPFELPKPTPVVPETAEETSEETIEVDTQPTVFKRVVSDGWQFWVQADYALAFLKAKPLPAIATTSPAGTAQAAAGVLGLPGTTDLIGNTGISAGPRSMGRLNFGYWFDPERLWGVGAGFFVTESKGEAFTTTSDGSTIIARPFTDAATGTPSSVLAAFPGVSSGSVNAYAAMQTFWGANVDLRECVVELPWLRTESLFGYRYLHYGENLEVVQNLLATGGAFVPGTKIISGDSFQTINDFHGVEFGFQTELFSDRWSLDILTKMAAGSMRRLTIINGSTQTSVPGSTTTTAAGGVFALATNIGSQHSNDWVVAPEFGLNVGYKLTDNVRLRLGYSFLFLDGIARAADQIDFTINQNQFPPAISGGPIRPVNSPVRSDIWVQSINFGVEIQY